MFCLVLSLLLLLVGPAAAVAAAYLPTTELRAPQGGMRSSRYWPGDRGGNSPACLRPTANARLVGHCLDCIRPCTCMFGWSLHFDCSCGEMCVPLHFSTKSLKII